MIQGRKLEASCAELPNLRLHAGPYHVVVYFFLNRSACDSSRLSTTCEREARAGADEA
jgi:hypothetical protein